jgi:hypothetical protein
MLNIINYNKLSVNDTYNDVVEEANKAFFKNKYFEEEMEKLQRVADCYSTPDTASYNDIQSIKDELERIINTCIDKFNMKKTNYVKLFLDDIIPISVNGTMITPMIRNIDYDDVDDAGYLRNICEMVISCLESKGKYNDSTKMIIYVISIDCIEKNNPIGCIYVHEF